MSGEVDSATFVGVRVAGGLLPADLLARVVAGQAVEGLGSKDFHLAAGESVRDAANRVWAYLRGAWASYRQALAVLPDDDAATGLTRERFALVLLDQLGYGRVHLAGKGGLRVGERSFPISHQWGNVAIHLLGRVALDTRTKGIAGAAGASPQSMVQEFLNRSDEHLWAILANASALRLVRDSTSLVGSAYVEFDLEAIFDGDLFADFLVLYTLCHVSRLEVRDADVGAASCWLEHWRQDAVETGSRALNLLRDGVIDALQILGSGFLAHPDNGALRADLADNVISVEEINHALLRVTYRLLFTFVAEDRNALLDPEADPQIRRRYGDFFSTQRLRRTSRRRRGGRYGDRWEALKVVWRGLGSIDGLPELGLPGLGGLFEPGALDFLMDCSLSNQALQSAVYSLSLVREPRSQVLRIVDYRNLGAEELGSIYESLLELMPSWDAATKTYSLDVASGNQRKDTGSYYTPTSLVESLLDTALDPVLDEAEKSEDPAQALLQITMCDPACGSGHFLVGAARRLAKRVAAVQTGDPEPAPEAVRSAMREVIARCVYGVDVNPLAAELAKVSLWLEALEPGRPLTFLDAQIRVGNALAGATPQLIAQGLPDDAFKPIEGDDKKVAAAWAKQNKAERNAQGSMFDVDMVAANTALAEHVENMMSTPALSLADVHVQEQRLHAYTDSDAYRQQRLAADAWCAAFVWPKNHGAPPAITQRAITALIDGADPLTNNQRAEVDRLAAEYRFFHWHLEFPHIFPTEPSDNTDTVNDTTGWYGGFNVIIGNPPWEQVQLDAQEFFAATEPEIATTTNLSIRNRKIDRLSEENPLLHSAYLRAKRRMLATQRFIHASGLFPLTSYGRLNTAPLFAETARNILSGAGRLGLILPTGIATDAFNQYFFKDLVDNGSIASLYDFENAKPLFAGVHRSFKFCLLTLTGRDLREPEADFLFFAHDVVDLQRSESHFTLAPEEIFLLNPNTGTCPVFRCKRDAEIVLGIYKRLPVLNNSTAKNGNPWAIKYQMMFMMNTDSKLFRTAEMLEREGWYLDRVSYRRDGSRMVPLHEGKMGNQFDYRYASFFGSKDTEVLRNLDHGRDAVILPRYWVSDNQAVERQSRRCWGTETAVLGFRRVARNTDERTSIAAVLPWGAMSNSWILASGPDSKGIAILCAQFNSFIFDYALRQFLTQPSIPQSTFEQIPIIPPTEIRSSSIGGISDVHDFVVKRSVALSATGSELDDWAVECGSDEVEDWDDARRNVLRAELDAAFFHLYGIDRDDLDYIMETFPIVKREDIAEHAEYRTKQMILEVYDAMAGAERTGKPYSSPFNIEPSNRG